VTEDWPDPEGAGPLRALGQVEPPGPGVLDAAREALWSAVAEEMLSADPAGGTGRTRRARTGSLRDDVQRRRTDPGR
jgi:hypothetical protein